jgi:hypothetical protein
VPGIARLRVASWLLPVTVVGLLGCPQLLDDTFGLATPSDPDSNVCLGDACSVPFSAGTGGNVSQAGDGGAAGSNAAGSAGASSGGSAGSSGASGSAGSGGSAGSAGSAGSGVGGSADSGGSAGQAGSGAGSDCRTLEMSGSADGASSNCVGIHGWNDIARGTSASMTLSYQDGDPCFSGTIGTGANGWVVYNLTFANSDSGGGPTWNSTAQGVTGFDFAYRGPTQPASLHVLYKDPSGTNFCRIVSPTGAAVPFSDSHPDCSNNASSGTVDPTQLLNLTLEFPVNNQPYPVDFCVKISALD